MENSSSQMKSMKPALLKAGITLALSLAGVVLARTATQKCRLSTQQSQNDVDIQEPGSCEEEEEMFALKRRIEALQGREWELEKHFHHYQDLKDQEMQLMECLNKTVLETNVIEFMGREICLIEAANKRFEELAVDYLNLFMFLENFISENGKLHKKVKKLLRKSKEQSGILRKQIQSKETEILGAKMELELKGEYIRLMEDEINKKNARLDELRAAEESARSKIGKETASMEEDEETCSTHELKKRDGNEEFGSDNDVSKGNVGEGYSYFGWKTKNRAKSRKQKLMTKFKRFMKGGEKAKEEKHRNKCFPRHSASDEDDLHARTSCSTV